MTIAAHDGHFIRGRGAELIARGARPLAPVLTGGLFLVVVFLLFAVSSGMLGALGINHGGITGAVASKIHPATYLSFAALGLLMAARRNPASFFASVITRQPGTLAFLITILLLAAYIVLGERKGIATIFDTYLLAVAVALIAAELDPRDLGRAERLIHVLLAANAALALVEYAIGYRFFPFRFEGVELEWDMRSTGLSGHPLENAQLTSIYLVALLAGGGASMPAALRPAAVLLQLAALVPFGGRTAMLLTLAMMAVWLVPHIVRLLRGGRISLIALASLAILLPILPLAIAAFAAGGFFDVLLVRFSDDSGSAKTRLEMFEIFRQLSAHDILLGASPDMIDSIRRSLGLELGIENPLVRFVLYQGAVFTGFLTVGLVLFLVEIMRRLRPGYGIALLSFVILVNSYESISNKTVGLAQFIVLMIAMFHRPEPAWLAFGGDGRLQTRPATQPSEVST
ncbi:MAG: hypothetical protein E6G97_14570 [Alphaproteobacteria bacterium]|nr:MAG: hypothetical protein E6G97_14570 [Alphaproteobacteria bacterium]